MRVVEGGRKRLFTEKNSIKGKISEERSVENNENEEGKKWCSGKGAARGVKG